MYSIIYTTEWLKQLKKIKEKKEIILVARLLVARLLVAPQPL